MADKTEKLLNICADTMEMPGWQDSLNIIVENTERKYRFNALSDEELADVAGGINGFG